MDWLAAGTYDRSVGLSLFTLQITHKIAEDTDVERDHIVGIDDRGGSAVAVEVIENFSTGYHSRNGGGDRIETDGDLPIVDLRASRRARVADESRRQTAAACGRSRRSSERGRAIARGALYLFIAVLLFNGGFMHKFAGDAGRHLSPDDLQRLSNVTALLLIISAIIDIGLGFAVLAGRNWARIALMGVCALGASTAFIEQIRGTDKISLADLLPTAGSVLVLLALSSHRARDYALWRRRRVWLAAHRTGADGAAWPAGRFRSRSRRRSRRRRRRAAATTGSPPSRRMTPSTTDTSGSIAVLAGKLAARSPSWYARWVTITLATPKIESATRGTRNRSCPKGCSPCAFQIVVTESNKTATKPNHAPATPPQVAAFTAGVPPSLRRRAPRRRRPPRSGTTPMSRAPT